MSGAMRILVGFGHNKSAVATWPKSVPMTMLSEHWARNNHSQSLARLNERGGLSPSEMLANIERRKFARMDETEAAHKLIDLIAAHLAQP